MSTIYLLHFQIPICPTRTTQHYLGYTKDLDTRLQQHRAGCTNAGRLTQVAAERNIPFVLARIWHGGRPLERQLKNRHESPRLCPLCNPQALNLAAAK